MCQNWCFDSTAVDLFDAKKSNNILQGNIIVNYLRIIMHILIRMLIGSQYTGTDTGESAAKQPPSNARNSKLLEYLAGGSQVLDVKVFHEFLNAPSGKRFYYTILITFLCCNNVGLT